MNLRKWVDLSGGVLLRNIGALREDLTNAADRIEQLERKLAEAQRDAGRRVSIPRDFAWSLVNLLRGHGELEKANHLHAYIDHADKARGA